MSVLSVILKSAVLTAALQIPASACAVCNGDPTSYVADASNAVFWMLLGLVGFIFAATALTALYIWRRAKAPISPAVQLIESL